MRQARAVLHWLWRPVAVALRWLVERVCRRRWCFLVLLGPDIRQGRWNKNPRWAADQTSFVRSIAPAMGGRRWFFRRQALDTEVDANELPRSMRLYAELAPGEAIADVAHVLAAAMPAGWALKHWAVWNRRFSDALEKTGRPDAFGGIEAQKVFMVGFCSALARSVATGNDPHPWAVGHWIEELLGTRAPEEIAHLLSIPTK